MQTEYSITIAVFCNRKDLFLAKICVASIRYYYPLIPIELIKDAGNGAFNTNDLETYFNVKPVDLGIARMGWGASKIHYISSIPNGKKVLLLDADIVFTSPFLERLAEGISRYDWLVSREVVEDPCDPFILETYFNYSKIKAAYPGFVYPGFVFNTGQMFITGGTVTRKDLEPFFDFDHYPFWKNRQLFPMVDQTVLNILLPMLSMEKKLKIGTDKFMIWGMSNAAMDLSLTAIEAKTSMDGLVHWAGCVRVSYVRKMSRGDILLFFENYYYEKVPLGALRKTGKRMISRFDFHLRFIYRSSIKEIQNEIFKLRNKNSVLF